MSYHADADREDWDEAYRGQRPVPGFERVMLYDPATGTTRSAIVGRGTVIDGVAIRRSQIPGARSD